MPARPSRRMFLSAAATTAAIAIVPRHVLGAGQIAPSEKMNVAGIGVGGQGFNDIRNISTTENLVAICDVDQRAVQRVMKEFPKANWHSDYRKMLDSQKNIDAVMIATPDHLHAVVTMAAIKAGKHVYCEKPLTHTVAEARAIRRAAELSHVATQMGNHGQASETARVMTEMIWAGAIGTVREIHSGSNRKPDISQRGVTRPADTPPVPPYLNWDMWVGPAPMRPYHPAYLPFTWRGWWDFGSGVLGDIGCHQLFPVFRALGLTLPTHVDASSSNWQLSDKIAGETAPVSSLVRFKFPAGKMGNGAPRGPIDLTWYDGGIKPPRPEEWEPERPFAVGDFTLIVGDKAKIYDHRMIPDLRQKEYGKPPVKLERSPGHYIEWINACKGGKPAGACFDGLAAQVTETILLGNISIRANTPIIYDAEKGKITNSAEADALIHPPYREGWSL